jgi:hypothetical protein
MATRSTISLKVSEGDKGKVFHFDISKLPKSVSVYEDDFIDKIGDVKLEKDYLTIYHHWSGYPDGVGYTLVKKFNDYDTILNLLCGGDASSINCESIIQYCAWRGDEWEYVQPKQSDTEPSVTEEYAYLFKDGKWFFKGYEAEEWTDLKEYL